MNVLGIFVKQPVPGRVKTRLANDLGEDRAAELYAAFIADVADRFRSFAAQRFLCFAPNDAAARAYFRSVAQSDYQLWPQPEGPLGERMARFFKHGAGQGGERVVVIGSDSPTLPRDLLAAAFRALDGRDCVLGPATDGGYYLIGQRAPVAALFDDIQWSSAGVLRQTAARVEQLGLSLEVLPPWYDVDTTEDLQLLRGHLQALRLAGRSADAPHTVRCLAEELSPRADEPGKPGR